MQRSLCFILTAAIVCAAPLALAGQPNLTLDYFSSTTSFYAGQPATVSVYVKNPGTSDSGAFTVRIYLSVDTTQSADDTVLADAAVTAVAQGASVAATWNGNAPSLPLGSYYVICRIDFQNQVVESDENDNYWYKTTPIQYPAALPNLSLNYFSTSKTYFSGQTVSPGIFVKNTGTADSGAFAVRFYLSTDITQSADDTVLGDGTATGVAQGANVEVKWTGNAPALSAGKYYLLCKIDILGQVTETEEGDNSWYFTTQITYPTALDSPPVALPASPSVGQPVTFNVIGDAHAEYDWDFGDGTGSDEASPYHIYSAAGTYTVTVALYSGETVQSGTLQVAVVAAASTGSNAEFEAEVLQLQMADALEWLGEAMLEMEDGDRTGAGTALFLADELGTEMSKTANKSAVATFFGKKSKTVKGAVLKLENAIYAAKVTRDNYSGVSDKDPVIVKSITKAISTAYKTFQTVFKAMPPPAAGGGTDECPFFFLEEVKSRTAGFHEPGTVLTFRIVTKDKQPLPAHSRLEVTGAVVETGVTQPAPTNFTLTTGPNGGMAHVVVRCDGMRRCRLLFVKGDHNHPDPDPNPDPNPDPDPNPGDGWILELTVVGNGTVTSTDGKINATGPGVYTANYAAAAPSTVLNATHSNPSGMISWGGALSFNLSGFGTSSAAGLPPGTGTVKATVTFK